MAKSFHKPMAGTTQRHGVDTASVYTDTGLNGIAHLLLAPLSGDAMHGMLAQTLSVESDPATIGADAVTNAVPPTISLTTSGTAYTQNFDTLANIAGSTTNTLTIDGWALTETGGGARDNEQYAVDTGGSNTGDTFSYGAAGSTERALGELRSGTLIPNFGAAFTNNTGATITSLAIAYFGEQWRFGGVHSTIAERLNFQISYDATSLTTGTWNDVDALDFSPPITSGTAGALDGNAAANRVAISSNLSSLTADRAPTRLPAARATTSSTALAAPTGWPAAVDRIPSSTPRHWNRRRSPSTSWSISIIPPTRSICRSQSAASRTSSAAVSSAPPPSTPISTPR